MLAWVQSHSLNPSTTNVPVNEDPGAGCEWPPHQTSADHHGGRRSCQRVRDLHLVARHHTRRGAEHTAGHPKLRPHGEHLAWLAWLEGRAQKLERDASSSLPGAADEYAIHRLATPLRDLPGHFCVQPHGVGLGVEFYSVSLAVGEVNGAPVADHARGGHRGAPPAGARDGALGVAGLDLVVRFVLCLLPKPIPLLRVGPIWARAVRALAALAVRRLRGRLRRGRSRLGRGRFARRRLVFVFVLGRFRDTRPAEQTPRSLLAVLAHAR
mmetsp:Transcript_15710/g.43917  ORF Transcript_15710/g.43917 Transcript_15710/m.43917 type:complete len:268 (-) Transcript_15710:30-833(-)